MRAFLVRLNARLKGFRFYLLAALAALPDILTGLGAVDLSSVIEPGLAAKVGAGIAISRVVLIPLLAQLRPASGDPR